MWRRRANRNTRSLVPLTFPYASPAVVSLPRSRSSESIRCLSSASGASCPSTDWRLVKHATPPPPPSSIALTHSMLALHRTALHWSLAVSLGMVWYGWDGMAPVRSFVRSFAHSLLFLRAFSLSVGVGERGSLRSQAARASSSAPPS